MSTHKLQSNKVVRMWSRSTSWSSLLFSYFPSGKSIIQFMLSSLCIEVLCSNHTWLILIINLSQLTQAHDIFCILSILFWYWHKKQTYPQQIPELHFICFPSLENWIWMRPYSLKLARKHNIWSHILNLWASPWKSAWEITFFFFFFDNRGNFHDQALRTLHGDKSAWEIIIL